MKVMGLADHFDLISAAEGYANPFACGSRHQQPQSSIRTACQGSSHNATSA
jgi:hypothetical protein